MSGKHTPGPWNYCQESVDPEWWIVTIPGGLVVANVNAHFCQEANARLIAAGPELLDAAKMIAAVLIAGGHDPESKGLVQLRAAIAKATTP